MAISDDFSVAVSGDIRHVSGTTRYTVLAFHRWLQDLADNASTSGDDLLDITSGTPSARATDNIITLNSPYNIDDTAAQYLYDGSIEQAAGATLYSGLVIVGSVVAGTTIQVVQNNALYNTETPFWGQGINADAAANILCRMMIKTRAMGNDIDSKKIRVFAREWGSTFSEFEVTMGLGNSVAAIFTSSDLNNTTAVATIAGLTTITNVEGYQTIDLNNGAGAVPFYSQWDKKGYSINQLYERAKYLTRRGSTDSLYGFTSGALFRGITHQWAFTSGSGAFTQNEILTWGTGATAGSARLLAIDSSAATGNMWVQLITGVAPTNGTTVTGQSSAKTATAGTPTARTVPSVFLGQSTGSAIIGAFGVGIKSTCLTNNDKVFDLTNTQQTPPNNVTFTVYGLVSGDRILVTNSSGGVIDVNQMSLNGTLNSAGTTSVVVTSIPADTATTGNLRIKLDTGIYMLVPYTAHNGTTTFTIGSTDFSGANTATTGNGVFLGYIDKATGSTSEAFTVKYSADRTLFVRVRNGGGSPIKTFETTASLGTGGGSATAIRTADA